MNRYRAVRLPGRVSWMIEIENDGLSGDLRKRCVCYRDDNGRHWPMLFKSKANAEHHIANLVADIDRGEVGDWRP